MRSTDDIADVARRMIAFSARFTLYSEESDPRADESLRNVARKSSRISSSAASLASTDHLIVPVIAWNGEHPSCAASTVAFAEGALSGFEGSSSKIEASSTDAEHGAPRTAGDARCVDHTPALLDNDARWEDEVMRFSTHSDGVFDASDTFVRSSIGFFRGCDGKFVPGRPGFEG